MITKKRMRQALNGMAAAQNKAVKYREIIDEYSIQEFGATPCDVDCDAYIDEMEGGASAGMTVNEFNAAMRLSIELNTAE